MSNTLFCMSLKPGKLEDYKKFVDITAADKKAEWADMLKRYDLHSVEIYHKNISGVDYIYVLHDVGPKAFDLLANWNNSDNKFDQWFGAQLTAVLDTGATDGLAETLFQMKVNA